MSDSNAMDNEMEDAVGVSGFGGRPLESVMAADAVAADGFDGVRQALADLGLVDCEQLIAATAVTGIQAKLRNRLGMSTPNFRSLLDSARSELTDARKDLFSRPAPRDLGFGVIPSEDIIAAAEAMAADSGPEVVVREAAALPESVNLVPFMSAIRNQGARGTCVSFALTALNEYVLRRLGLRRDLSEQHLYYEIKLIDGAKQSCGTWQAKAVTALRDRGQCREYIWPYNPNQPCNNHGPLPPTARENGLEYRLNTVAVSARSVAAYKAKLAMEQPVTLSIPVYDSWYESNEVRRSGRITMRIGDEQYSGGHAVMAVGYQDSQNSPGGGYFIVRNSWSTRWAYESPYGAGYGTIPYQYIRNDAWEAYSTEPEDESAGGQSDEVSTTQPLVRIKVGSNVEITIEDGSLDKGPQKVSRSTSESGGPRSGPRPAKVSRSAAPPIDDDSED